MHLGRFAVNDVVAGVGDVIIDDIRVAEVRELLQKGSAKQIQARIPRLWVRCPGLLGFREQSHFEIRIC